jgi:hypothetical protein
MHFRFAAREGLAEGFLPRGDEVVDQIVGERHVRIFRHPELQIMAAKR